MRRAIAAAVMGGLVLGGAVATPSLAATEGAGKAHDKARQHTTANAMKTVAYQGYEFQVPADWPVYRLDQHPRTCVRYDVHAVYLGRPGPDMRCPAGLAGRAQTVSFIPGQGNAAGSGTGQAGGTELQRLPAVHAMIKQHSDTQELVVSLSAGTHAATVLGTYDANPGAVARVLGTLRPAPAGTAPSAQTGSEQALQRAQPTKPLKKGGVSPAWHGVPANWPTQVVEPATPGRPSKPGKPSKPSKPAAPARPAGGFDTCTAPPLATMRAWRHEYADIGIYIGGVNAACASGNLTASWVKRAAGMKWGFLPIYVGPQAPCWGYRGALINPKTAASKGNTAAADAVKRAKLLGLPKGSPIYYDMEAYNGNTSCKEAVLKFLGAWNRSVAAGGYVTGIYSSEASGIANVAEWTTGGNKGFTPPHAIWDARWDHVASLAGVLPAWPPAAKNKQYSGNVIGRVGGISLNIDKDIVGGPVAH